MMVGEPVYSYNDGTVTRTLKETFISNSQAVESGYYPCMNCKP